MKVKEFIKTIVLTVLIISSLVLSSKIWFSKELWPDGYNSFNYARNWNLFGLFSGSDNKALSLSQIFSPKQTYISKDEKNTLILPANSRSEALNTLLKGYLKDAVSKGEVEETKSEEFKKAAASNFIFLDFYNYISFEMLADYYGVEVNGDISDISNVKHILFNLYDAETLYIYAKNNKSGDSYRIKLSADLKELNSLCDDILKKVNKDTVSSSFAFENNFDKKAEGEDSKLLLDSFMLINLETSSLKNIEPVPLYDRNDSAYSQISKNFDIANTSARRFTDASGTVNFVENFATLKFHNSGLLEYNSLNQDEGVKLKGNFKSDYDVVKLVGEFTENLNKNFNLPDKNNYVFSGVKEDDDKYTVYFDILYDGVPVIIKDRDNEAFSHAIEAVFYGGRIISYKQILCGFTDNGSESEMQPMISALDEFYATYDTKKHSDLVINDIYNIYHFDIKTGMAELKNAVSLSNKEVVIVKP